MSKREHNNYVESLIRDWIVKYAPINMDSDTKEVMTAMLKEHGKELSCFVGFFESGNDN